MAIKVQKRLFIICIYDQEPTTCLVLNINKPRLDEIKNLGSNAKMAVSKVYAQTPYQDSRITSHSLFVWYLFVYFFATTVGDDVNPDTVVGKRKHGDNFIIVMFGYKTICLTQQFLLVFQGIIEKKVIKVCIAARKLTAVVKNLY